MTRCLFAPVIEHQWLTNKGLSPTVQVSFGELLDLQLVWMAQQSYNTLLMLQQDITRGRGMVDSLYQAGGGAGGTHNAVLSSEDYMKQSARNLNNIEDGFYMWVFVIYG